MIEVQCNWAVKSRNWKHTSGRMCAFYVYRKSQFNIQKENLEIIPILQWRSNKEAQDRRARRASEE